MDLACAALSDDICRVTMTRCLALDELVDDKGEVGALSRMRWYISAASGTRSTHEVTNNILTIAESPMAGGGQWAAPIWHGGWR